MLEDNSTEFKKEYTDKLIKSLVAFSNTSGGRIIIGIDNNGEIIGLKNPDETSRKCISAIADAVRPDITMNTNVRIDENDGKPLVIIDINEGDKKPYYIRDKGLRSEGVYVREGSASVPVTEVYFQQMIMNTKSKSFESSISFVQDLTFDYLKSKFEERLISLTDDNFESLHLTEGGKYTQLGYILSDQYEQPLKAAVFTDEYRSAFIDRAEYAGSILKQMDEAMSFIARYNRNSSVIEGTYRIDEKQFSEVSIREAIANAVIHRDYSLDDSILVSIYPAKIAITSPGGMRRPYSMDELMRGVSSLRNRNLAAILYRLKLIEAYGTGIPRIFGSYAGLPVKPVIEAGNSSFTITLPAKNGNGTTELMKFIEEKEEFTRSELEKELGMNKSEAVNTINEMLKNGTIVKRGNGRSIRYRPNRPI